MRRARRNLAFVTSRSSYRAVRCQAVRGSFSQGVRERLVLRARADAQYGVLPERRFCLRDRLRTRFTRLLLLRRRRRLEHQVPMSQATVWRERRLRHAFHSMARSLLRQSPQPGSGISIRRQFFASATSEITNNSCRPRTGTRVAGRIRSLPWRASSNRMIEDLGDGV